MFQKWVTRQGTLLENMASRSRVRSFSPMRNVIRDEMLQPRTAFASPAATFDTNWKTFEEESRGLNVHFVHSEHDEDFGSSMFGYHLTSGFNEYVGNGVHRRGEMLMESGIFGLWKRWEKIPHDFRNQNAPSGKTFVELSFGNSDVHLVFVVYLMGIFVAVLKMTFEYFVLQMDVDVDAGEIQVILSMRILAS